MKYDTVDELVTDLERLAPQLARAAQDVYDDWDQVDGYSDAYGTGGICDDVAAEMASVIGSKLRVDAWTFYDEYDTHTSVMVVIHDMMNDYEEMGVMVNVDIHPSHYEEGYGYTWRKIEGVRFDKRMVAVKDMSDVYEYHN